MNTHRTATALLCLGGGVVVIVVASGVAGCGGGQSPSNPCAATRPPPGPGTMTLCLGGALNGTLSQVDVATTRCSALEPDGFDGSFYTTFDGVETKWEFSADKGAGTFDLNAQSAALRLDISQAGKERNWSSANAAGRSGSLTIYPDRSGTVDVSLPERDFDTGGDVLGAPALTVKGTFRCPTDVG